MIVAAILVGLLAAWYLGLRAGGIAACVSAGLFLLAMIAPKLAWPIYLIVGAGVGILIFAGPRLAPPEDARVFRQGLRRVARLVRRRIGK
jgi:hypothetical protein